MPDNSYVLIIKNVTDEAGNVMEDQEYGFTFVGIEETILDAKVNVYPNPADNVLNLSFVSNNNSEIVISLTDITGKILYNEPANISAGSNNMQIDVSGLSKGMYILKLEEGVSSLQYRVIVK